MISPVERSCSIKALWAIAAPMEFSVKGFPLGVSAWPPACSTRSARGMSLVTVTSPGATCSAIQSSAMSGPASTITRAIIADLGIIMKALDTTQVFRP